MDKTQSLTSSLIELEKAQKLYAQLSRREDSSKDDILLELGHFLSRIQILLTAPFISRPRRLGLFGRIRG